jgi:hypothetical protein
VASGASSLNALQVASLETCGGGSSVSSYRMCLLYKRVLDAFFLLICLSRVYHSRHSFFLYLALRKHCTQQNWNRSVRVTNVFKLIRTELRTVPWIVRLAASVSPHKVGFNPRLVHVGFAMDKVALWHVFPWQHYSAEASQAFINLLIKLLHIYIMSNWVSLNNVVDLPNTVINLRLS